MNRPIAMGMIAAALLAAGCSKKQPTDTLPPPPADGNGAGAGANGADGSNGANGGYDSSAVGTTGLPGSQSDFVANVASDHILFDTDSSDVDPAAMEILRSQSAWLAKYPAVRVTIEGHTDERGTREYNLALGERRANAARNALIGLGVASTRIATISYGKERPADSGSDPSAWAQNRRAVTVTVQR